MKSKYILRADGIYYSNFGSTGEELYYRKYGMMWKIYLKEHHPAISELWAKYC